MKETTRERTALQKTRGLILAYFAIMCAGALVSLAQVLVSPYFVATGDYRLDTPLYVLFLFSKSAWTAFIPCTLGIGFLVLYGGLEISLVFKKDAESPARGSIFKENEQVSIVLLGVTVAAYLIWAFALHALLAGLMFGDYFAFLLPLLSIPGHVAIREELGLK